MLTVEDFSAFVAEVHGPPPGDSEAAPREPFPWQRALLARIVADERWPDVIDVPTGLGKTSVLDVAVFLAALRPDLARRRTFFVVDRRLVVDEAYEHAEKLRTALTRPDAPVCRQVAEALRAEGDDGDPLTVTRMRGGVTWDRVWVERPDRFAIVTGTVDQVGSRLLFRGYGVGEHARSIDAALVGTDSLIVVDEAHLATAFRTTVAAALDGDDWAIAGRLRPTLVTMSATTASSPGGAPPRVHRIGIDDERHPVAGARLRAGKRLRLVQVTTTRKKARTDLPRALAGLATNLTAHGVVGVVVNTVARARAVFELLDGTVDSMLLTGRSRPVDRDLLLDRHYDRIRIGRDRTDPRPFVLVATQTIEVGANVDLDALVTESAPLPALVQRLGRLNRLGLRPAPAPAYLVHDSSADAEDPVYGPARLATWEWLAGQAPIGTPRDPEGAGDGLDASPAALRALAATAPDAVRQTREPVVPVLDTGTLDAWTCTSPAPHPDPPVAPYLHGLSDETPPVTVLWRAGLPPRHEPQRWCDLVDLVPPVAGETIDIPTRELRRWLRGEPGDDAEPLADIEIAEPGAAEPEAPVAHPTGSAPVERVRDSQGRPLVLRYAGRGDAELITADRIRPGDTIVVPTSYGGCDRYGWHPDSTSPVVDVADLARGSDRPLLRVGPHLRDLARHTASDPVPAVAADPAEGVPTADRQPDALDRLIGHALDDPYADRPDGYLPHLLSLAETLHPADRLGRLVRALLDKGWPAGTGSPRRTRCAVTLAQQINEETGVVWTPEYPVVLTTTRAWSADDDSEAGSSTTAYPGRRITLEGHQEAVALRAAEMARNLGLPQRLVASVEVAARWHDEGKRDPRFQSMLFGGRRLAAELAPAPLAKSGLDPTNRAEARRVRIEAGLPAGMRHEALSERIAALRLAESGRRGVDLDPDLVRHLIASHHGRGRRLLPPIVDRNPVQVAVPGLATIDTAATVDLDAPARFARLNAEYGRWGLALLESVVRLADIWCSVREESAEPASNDDAGSGASGRTGDPVPRSTSRQVELPALDGRDLLGFLAALGTARLLAEHAGVETRLSFDETSARALLQSQVGGLDEIVDLLAGLVAAIPEGGVIPGVPANFPNAKVGTGKDPMRMPRDQLRSFWTRIDGDPQAPAVRRWFASLLTDLAVDAEGRAGLTPYTAPVGQQSLRSFFEKPLAQVRRDPRRLIREALTRWRRVDGYTGEYLDHRVLRGAADLPSGKSIEAGVPGATWLAIMALPLLRLTGTGTRVRGTLWHQVPGRRQPVMAWPLWRRPLDLDAIGALLEHPSLRPTLLGESLTVDPRCWPALGVFSMAAAARRPMEERKSAGVLTPVSVTVEATTRRSGSAG